VQLALRKDSGLGVDTILLLSEAEHTELDGELEKRLTEFAELRAHGSDMSTAGLILRAGSRNLEPAVIAYLEWKKTFAV
jgi:molybdopterin biosynthesis enzyme